MHLILTSPGPAGSVEKKEYVSRRFRAATGCFQKSYFGARQQARGTCGTVAFAADSRRGQAAKEEEGNPLTSTQATFDSQTYE
jgi:hypothetical protein